MALAMGSRWARDGLFCDSIAKLAEIITKHEEPALWIVSMRESEEQIELARRLAAAGIVWFAIPNGGSRDVREARNLKRQGVQAGVPDLVILSTAEHAPRGVALELKRADGSLRDVRPEQWAWLARFEAAGFVAVVGLGWRDSLKRLQQLGYEVR